MPRLPEELLCATAETIKVLAHPVRLRLVEVLEQIGEAPVHRLVEEVGQPQAIVSHHLHRLRLAQIVCAERRGKEVYYRICDLHAVMILNCMRKKAEESS